MLTPDCIVVIFDRDGLQDSPTQQFETWREVVFHLFRCSLLRHKLMELLLGYFRLLLELDIDSLRSSHRPHV